MRRVTGERGFQEGGYDVRSADNRFSGLDSTVAGGGHPRGAREHPGGKGLDAGLAASSYVGTGMYA